MNKPDIVTEIEKLLDITLHLAPVRTVYGRDLLGGLMPYKRNTPKYAWDEEGDKLVGLNLADIGLTDQKWQEVVNLEDFRVKDIQGLNLSDNGLTRFEANEDFANLVFLNLSDNEDLSYVNLVPSMAQLIRLDLAGCKIAELSFGGGMPKLEVIAVEENSLEELILPTNLASLKNIFLQKNNLKTLVFPDAPENLEILDIRNNQLENLPVNFLDFTSLRLLRIYANPLSSIPPEYQPQDAGDNSLVSIRSYLRSLAEDEAVPNDELKLVLLGNSTVGKSSLLYYLIDKTFDDDRPSTHGIINKMWEPKGKDFKVNVWDFGGQEFYHATHRLFLSQNAVALVLFDEETNVQGKKETSIVLYEDGEKKRFQEELEHFPFIYWLRNLKHFCQASPVTFLIQNKMDIEGTKEVSTAEAEKFDISSRHIVPISIKGAFEEVEEFEDEYDTFEKRLIRALSNTKAIYKISRKWLDIKEKLRELAPTKPLLSYNEYKALCENIRPNISEIREGEDTSLLDALTDYLHQIGVILYYKNIPELKDTVFINPQWITDLIYKVLDYSVVHNEGKFDLAHVKRVVKDIDAEQIIALMETFELIFRAEKESNDTFVAPQYLASEVPTYKSFRRIVNSCKELAFKLRYPYFLPKSVISRFICRFGALSNDDFWGTGILFEKSDIHVLVEQIDNEISVKVSELEPDLVKEIFENFGKINERNPKVQVSIDGEIFVEVKELDTIKPEQKYIKTVEENGSTALKPFLILKGVEFKEHFVDHIKIVNSGGAPKNEPVVLLAFANCEQRHLKHLKEESSNLNTQLHDFHDKRLLELWREESTTMDEISNLFKRFYQRISIFHYGGHAGGELLQLEDGDASSKGLSQHLSLQKENLALVFLNGCSTAPQIERLIELGVKAVIATSVEIGDKRAMDFSNSFYGSLKYGRSIETSFRQACADVLTKIDNAKIYKEPQIVSRGFNISDDDVVAHKDFPWALYVNKDHKYILNWRLTDGFDFKRAESKTKD